MNSVKVLLSLLLTQRMPLASVATVKRSNNCVDEWGEPESSCPELDRCVSSESPQSANQAVPNPASAGIQMPFADQHFSRSLASSISDLFGRI